jgi:hypothetical protein
MSYGGDKYKAWHWGKESEGSQEWDDPDVDSVLWNPDGVVIETGRLKEIHIREPHKRTDTVIKLSVDEANASHLVFDPDHPNQRMYIFSHVDFTKKMKKDYLNNPKRSKYYNKMPLSKAAKLVGGHHDSDYPNVSVVPIGILTHVVYATEKEGDGFSLYIHKMGEETGRPPALTMDSKGRLWIAGGDYVVVEAGITN